MTDAMITMNTTSSKSIEDVKPLAMELVALSKSLPEVTVMESSISLMTSTTMNPTMDAMPMTRMAGTSLRTPACARVPLFSVLIPLVPLRASALLIGIVESLFERLATLVPHNVGCNAAERLFGILGLTGHHPPPKQRVTAPSQE